MDYNLASMLVGDVLTIESTEGTRVLTRVTTDDWYMQGDPAFCSVASRCTPFGGYGGNNLGIVIGVVISPGSFDYAIGPRRITLNVTSITPP